MGSKQKGASKKKGPKGKKARARAKLDRQWGETAIVDDEQGRRVGKSRLLGRARKNTQVRFSDEKRSAHASEGGGIDEETKGNQASGILKSSKYTSQKFSPKDDKSSAKHGGTAFSDSDSDFEAGRTSGLSSLLKSIRKSKKHKKKESQSNNVSDEVMNPEVPVEDASENDDDASESDESSVEEMEVEENNLHDADEDDDDQESVDDNGDRSSLDLFHERFSRGPLSASEVKNPKLQNTKVTVDGLTELQFTQWTSSSNSPSSKDNLLIDGLSKLTSDNIQNDVESTFASNKKVLQRTWNRFHKKPMSEKQRLFYPLLARYMDMLVTTNSRKERGTMHKLHLLHLLNHVLTSRSRIQRHNRQLKDTNDESETDNAPSSKGKNSKDDLDDGDRFRDQGYTRPTVLVLLPIRASCHAFVSDLLRLAGADDSGPYMERFHEDFGDVDEEDDEEEDTQTPEQKARRKNVLQKKGKDWNELFGDKVNRDDDFKLGISILPKAASEKKSKKKQDSNVQVKLYTDFYKSDIIVASPLGLKLLLTSEEGEDVDCDFLSSIEICYLQRADVMMMQNWDHVNEVLRMLNQEPQKNNGTDFSRVRNYMLEGQAEYWRQLIISTDIIDPFILSAFKRFAKSISGSIKLREKTHPDQAALAKVFVPIKQVFQKIPISSFDQQSDGRVNYFVKNILPQILRYKQKHTMIYVPSYFDFVTLRNIFLKRELSFVTVHEYSRITETSRVRARFQQGRKPIMLYTGRCNFFYRHDMKGIRHLIFLGLPEHPQFYSDQVNLIQTLKDNLMSSNPDDELENAFTSDASCLALFTKFEGHALERIVGSSNCSRMLKSDKATFLFHS